MATALVTGGTSGIGAEFARQLASRGYGLVLVARDESRLRGAAESYAARGIHVETLRADLGDRADVERVARRIEDAERPIDVVVNNAGFGVHQGFVDGDPAVHDYAFEAMSRAVRVLSTAAARAMVPRRQGTILTVSSLQTYLATGSYAAIKASVTAFTESLAVELHGTGVTVTVVLPGWVSTEWHARAGVRTSSIPGWLWIQPEQVVSAALRDTDRGRVISIATARYRVLGWVIRHLPRSTVRWISRRLTARRRGPDASAAPGPITVDRKEG